MHPIDFFKFWLKRGFVTQRITLFSLIIFLSFSPALCPPADAASQIPVVVCPIQSDASPTIPSDKSITLDIPATIASELALYVGIHEVLLAPRGWTCTGWYTGGGSSLSVYPKWSSSDKGPIVISEDRGNQIFALSYGLYFPDVLDKADIQEASSSLNETEKQFLVPRFPSDKITYLNASTVLLITPPGQTGLATQLLPKSKNDADYEIMNVPVQGDLSVYFFGVQLTPELQPLRPYIVEYAKNCLLATETEPICGDDAGISTDTNDSNRPAQ